MRLRAARAGEEAELSALALRSKAHWGYDEAFLDACRAELEVTPEQIAAGAVTVADDGRIVGVSVLEGDELTMLFVEPSAIGTGVGRALLGAARAAAAAAGLDALTIESDPFAEPFYLSQGARRVGSRASASTGRPLPVLALPCGDHGGQ